MLVNGKTVLLKGQITQQLADKLSSLFMGTGYLWMDGKKHPFKGRLLLVTDAEQIMSFAPHCRKTTLTPEDKYLALQALFPDQKAVIEQLKEDPNAQQCCYSKLKTILNYKQQHPDVAIKDAINAPWQELETQLPQTTTDIDLDINLDPGIQQTFEAQRKRSVRSVLKHSPYVFIAGLTGVGKSTFVKTKLDEHQVFCDISKIEEWAKNDSTDKRKILFLDEANITNSQWSQFEDLFNDQPSILINGHYHQLTAQHKVIFAGNPTSYSGERHMPALFENHGSIISFDPLPPACLHHQALKPLLSTVLAESATEKVSRIFLRAYQQIVKQSADRVLITARELQTMALLFLAHLQKKPKEIDRIAQYSAYHIARNVLNPKQQEKFQDWFEQEFSLIDSNECINAAKPSAQSPSAKFIFTPTHQPLRQRLLDFLSIRNYRQQHPEPCKTIQGLGGIIFEGESGLGKSQFVIAALKQQGFKSAKLTDNPQLGGSDAKIFYHISAAMPLAEKKSSLLAAFRQGAIVVMDEINASTVMEDFLNAILTGIDPETGEHCQTSQGFMLIGTQNSIANDGRNAWSDALWRRMMKCKFPEYTQDDLMNILQIKGAGKLNPGAITLLNDFCQKRENAKANHATPPNWREFFDGANKICKRPQTCVANQLTTNGVFKPRNQSTTICGQKAAKPISQLHSSTPLRV